MQPPESSGSQSNITSSDVLLANQLYYGVEATEYDKKNHVNNPAILRYYHHLFRDYVFAGATDATTREWRACDVGCGTGFLASILNGRVGSFFSIDGTASMLKIARRKLVGHNALFVLADAQALPLPAASFDLVCSNAMLHHVFNYETVLMTMIGLLRRGGKLFLGYEPNAIPYRLFWPALKVAAAIVPEHRRREEIRQNSGQSEHDRLQGVDIHELSEYHIFQGRGIHPFRMRDALVRHGMTDIKVHFSSVFQFALLRDSGIPVPVHIIPDWIYTLSGPLSLSFSITATKL